jgi:hypothetical protein
LVAGALLPSVHAKRRNLGAESLGNEEESTNSDFNFTDCEVKAGTSHMIPFCTNGEPRLFGWLGAKAFVEHNNFAKRFSVMTKDSAKCLVSDDVEGSTSNPTRAIVKHCFDDLLAPTPEFDDPTKLSMLARGVTKCDPNYTTCDVDVVPCCYVDMPCIRFDPAVKDGSLKRLLKECGGNGIDGPLRQWWGGVLNLKHFVGLKKDKQMRATNDCDKQAKEVDPQQHCWLPVPSGSQGSPGDAKIAIPVYSPTWWANIVLAYITFGVEGVARMPSCRLPS